VSPATAAVLLAGGSGTRAGTAVNKVYAPVGGSPLLARSLAAPLACPFVRRVVVVVRAGDESRAREVLGSDARVTMTAGGPTRSASELAGLEALGEDIAAGDVRIVAIHDGARPLASPALWAAVVEAADHRGGAVPVLPLPLPVYTLDGGRLLLPGPGTLVRVQTPQAFRAGPLLEAFRRAAAAGFSGADTAATVERYSDLVVATVPGEASNLKVTHGEDLARAEALAARVARDPA